MYIAQDMNRHELGRAESLEDARKIFKEPTQIQQTKSDRWFVKIKSKRWGWLNAGVIVKDTSR